MSTHLTADRQTFTPNLPPAGAERLYFDAEGRLKRLSADGKITDVEGGGQASSSGDDEKIKAAVLATLREYGLIKK